jgi:hypothetical protein
VHEGGKRDALLHATGANAEHGHRRTNADKRNAVTVLLRDEEWGSWNSREISKICHVSHTFVDNVRRELSGNRYQIATTRKVQRGNTVYEQDTSRIGKRKEPEPADDSSVDPEPELPDTELDEAEYRSHSSMDSTPGGDLAERVMVVSCLAAVSISAHRTIPHVPKRP